MNIKNVHNLKQFNYIFILDAVFEDIKEVETFQTHEAEDSLNAKEVINLQSEPRETSSNDQEKRNRRKMSKNDQKMSNRHGSNHIVTGSPSRHSKGKYLDT
jgi:hypothetical protein